jgi:hypothetical protein
MWYVGGGSDGAVWSSADGESWRLDEDAAWGHRADQGLIVRADVIWMIGGRALAGSPPPVYAGVWSMDVSP